MERLLEKSLPAASVVWPELKPAEARSTFASPQLERSAGLQRTGWVSFKRLPVVQAPLEEALVSSLAIEIVADPEADFAAKFFDVLKRLQADDSGDAHGVLVMPMGTQLHNFALDVATAATHGVLTVVSEFQNMNRMVTQLREEAAEVAEAFDSNLQAFNTSIAARKADLLSPERDF